MKMDRRIAVFSRQLTEIMAAHLKNPSLPVVLPEAGKMIWTWFNDLSQARSWHANGPNPIAYVDIAAYAALMRWPLRPYEITIIRALDLTYTNAWYASRATHQEGVKKLPIRSDAAVTPELFDAIFT